MKVPMLDEDEFASVYSLYLQETDSVKGSNLVIERYKYDFSRMYKAYEEITGVNETNVRVILHHRISLYGQPCENCGKPLRAPRASFCAA